MEFRLPELGEGVYEAEFGAWAVNVGDAVRSGQTLAEVITDKAVMEIPSPFTGTIDSLKIEPGQQVKVGEVLLTYSGDSKRRQPQQTPQRAGHENAEGGTPAKSRSENAASKAPAQTVSDRTETTPVARKGARVGAAPSVRFMARKLGVDLSNVHGTGPGGRILIEDVAARFSDGVGANRSEPAESRLDYGIPGTRQKFLGVRRQIAEHLVHAKRTIPHYTYIDECDVTELVRLRESLKEHVSRSGVKLTYLAFFVRAVVEALKEVPIVNSSLDESAGEIVLHDRYHIGIATATQNGLIVPVIHDADKLDLTQTAREVERLTGLTRVGKVSRDDLRGGTFTITSIGGIGGLASTPVINHPEVGILGIGKVVKRPVYDHAGHIRPAEMVYLSLSFDHRVVDGAVGAAFANSVIRVLQRPGVLLLPPDGG